MSNKEELAALMASDGDYEKKISLLKKAVVTVTKQKQEIEGKHTQLQEELRTTTQHLMETQRENTVLQRKVKTLETQLEQERGSGSSAFGQNMLKGLSSIMGNSEAGGRGGRGGGGGGGRGGGSSGGGGAQLSLSAEDVERLVTENEQLHREKYSYKTRLEDAQRAGKKDTESLKAQVAQLQQQLSELHGTLDTVTARCDSLNSDYLAERALSDFCRHFFVATIRRTSEEATITSVRQPAAALPVTVDVHWPSTALAHDGGKNEFRQLSTSPNEASTLHGALSPEAVEQVLLVLLSACGTVKTLLRGISVLIVVLREQLPRRERATVGDLACLRDRLSVFLDAHNIKRDRLMYLLEQLEAHLAQLRQQCQRAEERSGPSGTMTPTAESLVEAQAEVLQLFVEWISLLRAHTPLLVESCVSYLPQGHTYTLRMRSGGGGGGGVAGSAVDSACAPLSASLPTTITTTTTTTDRAEFVEEVTKYGYATLASVEGSLAAVRMLVQQSPAAYTASPPQSRRVGGNILGVAEQREGDGDDDSSDVNTPLQGAATTTTVTAMDACALLALQQFWWEGCSSVRTLHAAARVLDCGVQDVAEACNKSEIRDALQCISRCLRTLTAAPSRGGETSQNADADAALYALQLNQNRLGGGPNGATSPGSPSPSRTPPPQTLAASAGSRAPLTPASAEAYEEVLVALAAADRAAATYHTQMNYLYMEMADREDALQTTAEAARQLKALLELERAEAEHTRRTMQEQISVLSNQLIEMADAAQAQRLSPQTH